MDNEEVSGVKFSEFPAEAPDSSDEIVGLHSGNNARFSISNLIFATRQGLASLFVPLTRRINNKALSSDISLTASDVGARANDWMPTAAQVGARPDTWTPSAQDVGAVPVASVGVAGGVPNLDEIGRVPQNQLPPYPTVPAASTSNPQDLGTASPGLSDDYARADHVHDMPSASDVGALASGGTAVAAGKLANAHSITTSDAGWYKFLTITMDTASQRQTMIIAIENRYGASCGLLRIHTHTNSYGTGFHYVGWIASGNSHSSVRWDYSDGTWTYYVYKGSNPAGLYFQVISKTDDTYGTWLSTLVEEPTTATDVSDTVALTAKSGLWFTSVAVSAGTAQQIIAISDAAITTDYVLSRIEWANPNYITDGYTWTTGAGSFTLSGTATAATTANVLLVRKGN